MTLEQFHRELGVLMKNRPDLLDKPFHISPPGAGMTMTPNAVVIIGNQPYALTRLQRHGEQ